jgi:hypothetical protein
MLAFVSRHRTLVIVVTLVVLGVAVAGILWQYQQNQQQALEAAKNKVFQANTKKLFDVSNALLQGKVSSTVTNNHFQVTTSDNQQYVIYITDGTTLFLRPKNYTSPFTAASLSDLQLGRGVIIYGLKIDQPLTIHASGISIDRVTAGKASK